MKTICHNFDGDIFFKCPSSETYYTVDAALPAYSQFSALCDNDPKFYQTCGAGHHEITSVDPTQVCGYYICENSSGVFTSGWAQRQGYSCDEEHQCKNTGLDETGCDGTFSSADGAVLPMSKACDGVCNLVSCEDEARCNLLTYGVFDKGGYYPPIRIGATENHPEAIFGSDGSGNRTALLEHKTCIHTYSNLLVPIFNYTRCATIVYSFANVDIAEWVLQPQTPYCSNFLDQTNCTDPLRVALSCEIGGYLSTVSIFVVCHGLENLQVCDNGIEDTCFDLSPSCKIHKHKMCDGKIDCSDESDESSAVCLSMTQEDCVRVLGRHRGRIPLAWLHDGIVDCESGIDETGINWPTCGAGVTHRFVTQNESCSEDFLCLEGDAKFIGLEVLCDKIETCGNENEICMISKGITRELVTMPISSERLDKHFIHCFRGLERLEELFGFCFQQTFSYPDDAIYGMNTMPAVTIPLTPMDCDHSFGEIYLFMSCTNKCSNSSCPLKRTLKHDSCPGQIQDRIYTLINNEELTFVTKVKETFRNDYFLCENKRCISYESVCNLVNDCGDFSDEAMCTNHFQCNSSGDYISKARVCDGKIDCDDLSDECNSSCGKEIIEGVFLKVLSWTIGSLAVILNLVIICKGFNTESTPVLFLNRGLIILISMGDLLMGVYLLTISIVDMLYGKGYCTDQIRWVTSSYCSTLGVISTIGSQLSLFSMTILSLTRFLGIKNAMTMRSRGSRASILSKSIGIMLSVILFSVVIAIVPLLPQLDDFFVNGLTYESTNTLFIGVTDKKTHFQIIKAYYGRMKLKNIGWHQINIMIGEMFSDDYGGIAGSNANFYGNDGVCLFKYFVHFDDPQKEYVWTILIINLTSFLIISCCYTYISFVSIKSSQIITKKMANKAVQSRNRKLQRKVSIIIMTDFMCWVPFILLCALHTLGVTDASNFYAIFSIVIIPINSVINPLLYDSTLTEYSSRSVRWAFSLVTRNTRVFSNVIETGQDLVTIMETHKKPVTIIETHEVASNDHGNSQVASNDHRNSQVASNVNGAAKLAVSGKPCHVGKKIECSSVIVHRERSEVGVISKETSESSL